MYLSCYMSLSLPVLLSICSLALAAWQYAVSQQYIPSASVKYNWVQLNASHIKCQMGIKWSLVILGICPGHPSKPNVMCLGICPGSSVHILYCAIQSTVSFPDRIQILGRGYLSLSISHTPQHLLLNLPVWQYAEPQQTSLQHSL